MLRFEVSILGHRLHDQPGTADASGVKYTRGQHVTQGRGGFISLFRKVEV